MQGIPDNQQENTNSSRKWIKDMNGQFTGKLTKQTNI
jgi:hypothetical protein